METENEIPRVYLLTDKELDAIIRALNSTKYIKEKDAIVRKLQRQKTESEKHRE